MDITTLAAANAYTDKKVAEGGGSGGGGGLPVVELTTVATTEGAALTDAENAKMLELAANVAPIFIKCPVSFDGGVGEVAGVATMFVIEGVAVFEVKCSYWSVNILPQSESTFIAVFTNTD